MRRRLSEGNGEAMLGKGRSGEMGRSRELRKGEGMLGNGRVVGR